MSNLIELQRNYILSFINEIQTEHNLKFLIIDETVDALLNSVFADRNELLRIVTAVDKIDSPKRKGQPSVEAIYMLEPSKFNINCMDADFSNRPPKYKRAHVRFLPGFKDHLVRFFDTKRYLPQYICTLAEVQCAFIPKESILFQTVGLDQPLQVFYNKRCTDLIERNITKTVECLLNICIVTGEYPTVRYSQPSAETYETSPSTMLAKKLAFEFQEALDDYARKDESFPPPSPRPRAVLVITERSLDPFSLLLHDFSYQAMAYDLVPEVNTQTDTYQYFAENEVGEKEEKLAKLREIDDPDWVELRHQHIMDATDYLNAKVNELIAKNPLLVDRANVKTTTDLLSVVAHLKDFDEDRRRITLHRTLIDQCLSVNEQRRLAELADYEQAMVGFGLDADGNRYKGATENLLETLMSKNANITDKVRFILIYALFRGGLIEQDFAKLLAFIGVSSGHSFFKHFMTLITNFQSLGFPLIKSKPSDKPFKKEWHHETIVNDASVYNTSRFVCAVSNNLSKVITNQLLLSEEAFPYVKDKPIEVLEESTVEDANFSYSSTSLRNPRHKASWTRKNTQNRAPRQRFFYYSIGGLTYGEIRAAYLQSQLKNKDVFIGTDTILTPLDVMQGIEKLSEPREQLNLRVDAKEKESPPGFLFDRALAAPVAAQHVHKTSHQKSNADVQPVMPAPPPQEKKRSKLSKFLRSK
ncbi:LANO_0H05380g1_1 [Lachancea nothofagi CBS 11611]|uniref:LANO_0H05380g1_1 n=1 Tax=Lachancea nothofagi CBS 11611 TaxID=1266666 RepID=A0A1G4KL96_9SACH|nr:LANO_0H05380g1_1 [Lachancea nothofagi CBS 11611]